MIQPFAPLYAIIDRGTLDARGIGVQAFAAELSEAGVRLVQYRDKRHGDEEILRTAREIEDAFAGTGTQLILNDRVDLAIRLEWGVHVGQGDAPVASARAMNPKRDFVVGVSTHNEKQLCEAEWTSASYIAIGPVYGTTTKTDAEPVVGLDGVRKARSLTTKPLVAIGGISHETAREVIDAGADCVAVIGALLPAEGRTTRQRAKELIALLSL
jgi:thiamine-phosphate pyrophosphorylase